MFVLHAENIYNTASLLRLKLNYNMKRIEKHLSLNLGLATIFFMSSSPPDCVCRLDRCLSCLRMTSHSRYGHHMVSDGSSVLLQCSCWHSQTHRPLPHLFLSVFTHFLPPSIFVCSCLFLPVCSIWTITFLLHFFPLLVRHSFSVLSFFHPLHFLHHVFIHTSFLLSSLPKGSHSCYHTERAGMAGYALANWERFVSLSAAGLTRFRILPLQAFESLLQLYEARATYEEFCIPMCMLPATISNNVPGTDLSIGADTALNAIVEVRQSNRRRHSFDRFFANRMKMTQHHLSKMLMVQC